VVGLATTLNIFPDQPIEIPPDLGVANGIMPRVGEARRHQ
jgi:hypothetical protein